MTDCGSIHGSTTSSSSDVTTLTTASSWCSISASSRVRVVRLIRPHPRRILVTPNSNSSFGFALRGGKEFGTGFFVSNIERYGEADHKGLKIGDQILRVNRYRVADAVHKELVQFISSQDRLTLKVRGVGMLPMKDKENDPLTWHVVRASSLPSSYTEDSLKSHIHHRRNQRSKDVRVLLTVAPRTKLGLGICKGPEWKPGIFIQFTKEKSVAREAGLRPGDQILSVNCIDFSDVLFSEAVAVMKSSTKLDMVVRTSAGCDLFPGESSGYNSSASSVTGDQSPCWADVSAKRLTVVCEEPPNNTNDHVYADVRKMSRSRDSDKLLASGDTGTLKELNKTIIKLSENGMSINNTYIEDSRMLSKQRSTKNSDNDQASDYVEEAVFKPIPPPPPPITSTVNKANESNGSIPSQKVADICFVSRQSETKTVIVEVHRSDSNHKKPQQQLRFVSPDIARSDTLTRTQTERLESDSTKGDSIANGSTLCSAIAEELKKRKEKQCNTESNISQSNHNTANQGDHYHIGPPSEQLSTIVKPRFKHGQVNNKSTRNGSDHHSALMDEFKRAHQRMFKNGFQETDHKFVDGTMAMHRSTDEEIPIMRPASRGRSFVTLSTYKERQDDLKNTVVMDDEANKSSVNSRSDSDLRPSEYATPKPLNMESNTTHALYSKSTLKSSNLPRPESQKPPNSPTPDYEHVQIRGTIPKHTYKMQDASTNEATTTGNRRTMRLGTVTIGEYTQNQRKDQVKFGFLEHRTNKEEKVDSKQEDNSSLHSELQDTLTRSNLKLTAYGGSDGIILEHQSHCQLHNNRESTNVEKLTRMLQHRQNQNETRTTTMSESLNQTVNQKIDNIGNGILKNGSSKRNSKSSFSKSSEKSISFGN